MVILYIGPSILIEEVKYDWVQFLTWLQLCLREYFTVISPVFSLYFELTLKKKENPALYITMPIFILIQLIFIVGLTLCQKLR